MVKTTRPAFGTWLLRQRHRRSYPIRDLALEYASDPCKPRRATVERFREHLLHHSPYNRGVLRAFSLAVRAYKAHLKVSY